MLFDRHDRRKSCALPIGEILNITRTIVMALKDLLNDNELKR